MNWESALVATLAVVPVDADMMGAHLNFTSARPTSLYGADQAWPLPFPSTQPSSQTELNDFLAHSATGHQLRVQMEDWAAHRERYREMSASEGQDFTPPEPTFMTFISMRTAVFGAHDYPKYSEEGFENALTALRAFKVCRAAHCRPELNSSQAKCGTKHFFWDQECHRAFGKDGHFESILEVDTAGKKGWFYGPYISVQPGPSSLTDFVRLPNQTEMKDKDPSDVPGE